MARLTIYSRATTLSNNLDDQGIATTRKPGDNVCKDIGGPLAKGSDPSKKMDIRLSLQALWGRPPQSKILLPKLMLQHLKPFIQVNTRFPSTVTSYRDLIAYKLFIQAAQPTPRSPAELNCDMQRRLMHKSMLVRI